MALEQVNYVLDAETGYLGLSSPTEDKPEPAEVPKEIKEIE